MLPPATLSKIPAVPVALLFKTRTPVVAPLVAPASKTPATPPVLKL
jgi:hypothetical protein